MHTHMHTHTHTHTHSAVGYDQRIVRLLYQDVCQSTGCDRLEAKEIERPGQKLLVKLITYLLDDAMY